MAKKRIIPLPESLSDLKVLLHKLKKKESELLTDLAIREAPEFEDAIVSLVGNFVFFETSEKILLLAEKPEAEEGNEPVQRQLTFFQKRRDHAAANGMNLIVYDEKIANLKGMLVSTKVSENFASYVEDRNKKAAAFVAEWGKWEPLFEEAEVNLAELLPTGAEAYRRACACISRKGK